MRFVLVFSSFLIFILFSCKDQEGVPNEKILLDDGWQIQSLGTTSDSIFSYDRYLFKREFQLPNLGKDQYVSLNFDRANQSAIVSLNSHQIISESDLENPYATRKFPIITSQLEENNTIEIEALYTDWATPGGMSNERLKGITDMRKSLIGNAYLKITGNVSIVSSEIQTKVNTVTLEQAWLTLTTVLRNNSNKAVKGKLIVNFEDRDFSVPVKLNPHEEKELVLDAEQIPELSVSNPRIWWINNMGNAELYMMHLSVETEGKVSDTDEFPFCIREIKEYLTRHNQRAYMLNGKNVLIKGAAWDNDIYYKSTRENDEIQVQYAKDMNLNAIFFNSPRKEIKYPNELCDKYGLMALENMSVDCDTLAEVKMGPFEYVGPRYWYGDSITVPATGLNIGAGIGAQLPVIESLEKMIPAGQLTLDTLANNLDRLTFVIKERYGEITDINDYLNKADLLNYEDTKAMFEAFRNQFPLTGGIVQWKLTSALPSLYWQLFDYYLTPTPAYYSVKKANIPQQLLYNYKTNSIHYVNDVVIPVEMRAKISFYGIDSKLLYTSDFKFRVEVDRSKKIMDLDPIAGNVFMHLQLFDSKDNFVSENFYCLSEQMEEYNWNETDEMSDRIISYANYNSLNSMPESELSVNINTIPQEDDVMILHVEIETTNDIISFMTRLVLKDDGGNIILPVFWDDNYVSILPNETKKVQCKINVNLISGRNISLYLSGWNLPEKEIPVTF